MVSQVAGMVVGSSSGRIQSDGRQGGHAELLSSMIGPEAPQVVLCDRTGRHHMVNRPLETAKWKEK